MSAQRLFIFYFSGTGNSRNVAHWLAEEAQKHSFETHSFYVAGLETIPPEVVDEQSVIAFISPVHGFNYPPVMLKFLSRFPRGKAKVLLLNTRAGMLIGKWVTPGLSGITFYFAGVLLAIKGYRIRAMFPVDMPSNWISLHPGLNAKTILFLHQKNKIRVEEFAEIVFSGKRWFKSLREMIQDVVIWPVAVLYYFVGRFILAKTYYASNSCNNCGLCIRECPVHAISEINGHPFWSFNCESCMKCMGNCPTKAIETAHGFVVGVYLIYAFVASVFFYGYFTQFIPIIQHPVLKFVLNNLIFISILLLGYRLIHILLRFKLVNKLMIYTSLTHYKWWGRRYKALKLKEENGFGGY
jgi:ferredoxin